MLPQLWFLEPMQDHSLPLGSKVPNHRVFRVSILGNVFLVLGRYPIVEYLDP